MALTRRGPTPPVWLSDRFTDVILRVTGQCCQAIGKEKFSGREA
jgi:hypothetical protein